MVVVRWWQRKSSGGEGVGPQEADSLVGSGAVLVDVRQQTEWRAGHAPGARHVPLGRLEGALCAVPRNRRVVVCRSGSRWAGATTLLTRSGFDAVNLTGGMRAGAGAGFPVETADARPGTVV